MNAPATVGHNFNAADDESDKLSARAAELVKAANAWAEKKLKIENEDDAQKLTDFLEQLRGHLKGVEAWRKARKIPLDQQAKAIQDMALSLKEAVEAAGKLLGPRLDAFLAAKKARKLEETRKAEAEAAQKAKEADDARRAAEGSTRIEDQVKADKAAREADAATHAADRMSRQSAGVKGSYGAPARSLRKFIAGAKITDMDAAIAHFRGHEKFAACIQELACAEARAAGVNADVTIPGIEILKEERSV